MLLNTLTLVDEIDHAGGATWNLWAEPAVSGYMVSVRDAEYRVPSNEFSDLDIDLYVQSYASRVAESEHMYFGAWVDESTDEVVLDLSMNVQDATTAHLFADIADQDAVYNVTNQTVEHTR